MRKGYLYIFIISEPRRSHFHEERKLNLETFGQATVDQSRYRNNYRGRGNYRGGNRGGNNNNNNGYYRNNRNNNNYNPGNINNNGNNGGYRQNKVIFSSFDTCRNPLLNSFFLPFFSLKINKKLIKIIIITIFCTCFSRASSHLLKTKKKKIK